MNKGYEYDIANKEVLPKLLLEQFGESVPNYEVDANSVKILTHFLKNHIKIKKAKQLLIKNLNRELMELQKDNMCMEMQSVRVEDGSPVDIIAQCANELELLYPTSSQILQKVFVLETDIIEDHEQICKLEKQKLEYMQVQTQNQEINDFTERVLQTNDSYQEVMNQIESLITRLKVQINKLDVEEVQLTKFSALYNLEREMNKFLEK